MTTWVSPKWMVNKDQLMEGPMGHVVWNVVVHRQFLEDHSTLALDILWPKCWSKDDFAEQVYGIESMTRGHPTVIRRVFTCRVGVDITTGSVDSPRNFAGIDLCCSLEQQMLKEMADSGHGNRLISRADSNPHTNRH